MMTNPPTEPGPQQPWWYQPTYVEQPYPLMPPAAPPRHRGRLFATLAAVVVLIGGGVATYVAVSESSDHGAASARKAVEKIVSDVNNSDVLGMLDALAPPERRAIAEPLMKDFGELKRTHILSSDADLSHLSGAGATLSGLTYGSNITLNDHVQIVQITGGTVRVASDLSKLPFSSTFLNTIGFSRGLSGTHAAIVNIADTVRANHGEPVRVAAEKVDGHWYPSLLYTIAYYATEAAGLPQPGPAESVRAVGAGSPVDAVKHLVHALLGGDIAGAIGLSSPAEDAALHDYGGVLINRVGPSYPAAPLTLDRLDLRSTPGPNGEQLVALAGLSARVRHLGRVSLANSGGCLRVTIVGHTQRMCPNQSAGAVNRLVRGLAGKPLTPGQQRALRDLTLDDDWSRVGIVTTQVDGKWFVNPIQTLLGATTSVLQRFEGNDLLELIGLFRRIFLAPQTFGASGSGHGRICAAAPGQHC